MSRSSPTKAMPHRFGTLPLRVPLSPVDGSNVAVLGANTGAAACHGGSHGGPAGPPGPPSGNGGDDSEKATPSDKRPALLSANHPLFGASGSAPDETGSPAGESSPGDASAARAAAADKGNEPVGIRSGRSLLDPTHPTFGSSRDRPSTPDSDRFNGPVSVGGFFFTLNPTWSLPSAKHSMQPTAQLTIRDSDGRASRVRYVCKLEAAKGLKIEALIRFQIGWIAPRVKFTELPYRITLGRGFDISLPLLFHFTAVQILDERGHSTGSCLFFSGTPMLGFSLGFVSIARGELVHAARKPADPDTEVKHFVGHVHYRQLGFLAFKAAGYVFCALALIFNIGPILSQLRDYARELTAPYVVEGTMGFTVLSYVMAARQSTQRLRSFFVDPASKPEV